MALPSQLLQVSPVTSALPYVPREAPSVRGGTSHTLSLFSHSWFLPPKSYSSWVLLGVQEGNNGGSLGSFQYFREPNGNHAFT